MIACDIFKVSLCRFQLRASSACNLLFLYLLVCMLLFGVVCSEVKQLPQRDGVESALGIA